MPKDLNSKIKIKIIDNTIKQLKNNPELHNKIEFEIYQLITIFRTLKVKNFNTKNF